MANLERIRKSLDSQAEVADAFGDLAAFVGVVVTGSVVSGGALTLPLIIAQSGKATKALLKLTKALLPPGDTGIAVEESPDRADQLFYLLAHHAYLTALQSHQKTAPRTVKFDTKSHKKLTQELTKIAVQPERAEASFQFGWTPSSGSLQLFTSYGAWIQALMISMGSSDSETAKWLEKVDMSARKRLYSDLSSDKKENRWLWRYQLLSDTSNIKEILEGYIRNSSIPTEDSWKTYLLELKARPSNPIWGEEQDGLGIDRLFVDPDFYYSRRLESARMPLEAVAPIRSFLLGLMTGRRPSTELIFVMGGPGSGKTSLMQMVCADIAGTGKIHVVSMPAKSLDPKRGIFGEVQRYLSESGHKAVSESLASTEDCIIIIDGFDELAHASLSTLEEFFRDAQDLVRNKSHWRLRIVLSGRPNLFSADDVTIPPGSHVVTLAPFNEKRVADWTENWRQAKGGEFDGVAYLNSNSQEIKELASQPMLLYLLAKMFEEAMPIPIQFEDGGGARYRVYSGILDWVCRRQVGKGLAVEVNALLRRYLQVAGLATHQSGKRVLHWSRFSQTLERSGLAQEKSEIDNKAFGTILAFAFTNVEKQAWEFTHKSFGEALAAEAMGRIFEEISEEGRFGEPWRRSIMQATESWIYTFGPNFLTKDVLDFCEGWMETTSREAVEALIERLPDIYLNLLACKSARLLANCSQDFEIGMANVIGNSIRSWFAIANTSIRLLSRSGVGMKGMGHRLNFSSLREGIYLCQLVAVFSAGEVRDLLKHAIRFFQPAEGQRGRRLIRSNESMWARQQSIWALNDSRMHRFKFDLGRDIRTLHDLETRTLILDAANFEEGSSHSMLELALSILEASMEAASEDRL